MKFTINYNYETSVQPMDRQDAATAISFEHTSVLLAETVGKVLTNPNGIYVDCTLGGGGHSCSLAQHLAESGWLIAIDQDPQAIAAGKKRLSDAKCKVSIVQDNFKNLKQILDGLGVTQAAGILFDLGVSSHQLDTAGRGFSYMQEAVLDMRMNPDNDLSAFKVINTYSKERLAQIIAEYGEERWAKRIAEFIAEARGKQPVETTLQLVNIIKKAIPKNARKDGPHPAKRTFQAVRIEVNDELNILKKSFVDAVDKLIPGGRLAVITFHSLEDRIAKQTIKELSQGCRCPRSIPICVCGNTPKVKIISKAITPSEGELAKNPRSRSAKLRLAEKICSKIQEE